MKIINRYFSIYQICIYLGSFSSLAMNLGFIPFWRRFTFFELMVPILIPFVAYLLTTVFIFWFYFFRALIRDDD
jgi:hypothetical protein